ncbi:MULTISPECIES: hypothetical protein [Deinococcus]|uniref:ABM domain-containing protein n=2 Tax=Deinococcus TaxID=1298 RepID=A0A221STE6_9DEIO|nr:MULTISPECIES: hypothetical protein [Deinococcus]ASN79918.1 hypothetical protein DFI_01880 [Deinococcus ficus]MDP9765812.1 hypothetical protein [Deinococcus enclensis]GHF81054.1 hypothetical protein GCM10017782_18630 [Deinococcus ficus]
MTPDADPPRAATPDFVHYAELKGEDALARLDAWAATLSAQPGFSGAEVLTSPAQPGLALVASRWTAPVPPLALPDGVKAWVFVVQASVTPRA